MIIIAICNQLLVGSRERFQHQNGRSIVRIQPNSVVLKIYKNSFFVCVHSGPIHKYLEIWGGITSDLFSKYMELILTEDMSFYLFFKDLDLRCLFFLKESF